MIQNVIVLYDHFINLMPKNQNVKKILQIYIQKIKIVKTILTHQLF
jgi:hypothetical protein